MSQETDGYKLLLTYDIKPDAGQDYFRFMLGRYVPLMAEEGLEMSDAWHTAYGDQPSRLIGFLARDEETIRTLMESDIWEMLCREMERYVIDYSFKVVPYRQGFQF